ncbi:MAG: hypothetical protein EOP87_07130 [Verrucomicrobiaceae bacterium]|nr:MAG: hypothetical protein EOP87_07130 [Verrucomicrobiaceae bacterium]
MRLFFLSMIHLTAMCATGHAQEIFKTTGGKPPEHLLPLQHGSPHSLDLLSGPTDIGFYLREPSFGPEASLSFESNPPRATDPFNESEKSGPVVHIATVLELNINRRLVSDEALVRNRYTAEIDPELMTRVSRLWSLFLLQTSHPRANRTGLDGTEHFFAVRVEGYDLIQGQTWSPPKESLPGRFVAFAEKFIAMVKSDKKITPEERESLMTDLAALDAKLTARESALEKMDSRED